MNEEPALRGVTRDEDVMRTEPSHALELPSTSPDNDEVIVARVLAGHVPEFAILMRRHNQRLYRAARAILRNETEAEDALQDGYLAAFRALGSFEGRASFGAWMMKIVVHEAVRRRRRLGSSEIPGLTEQAAPEPSPEQSMSLREMAAVIETAIDSLPDGYREVLMLRDVAEVSTAEAADALELTEENVRVRLHRARELVRSAILRRTEQAGSEVFSFLGARCDGMVQRVMSSLLAVDA
jgi:RNA polymerase sigma-70 factor, ECF subfamily